MTRFDYGDQVRLDAVTRYVRLDIGPGLVGWVYSYWNRVPVVYEGLANGLEFGVQVAGTWTHQTSLDTALFEPGSAHHINIGESYRAAFDGSVDGGVQVGFAIYPRDMPELRGLDGELSFVAPGPRIDRHIMALCRALADSPNLPQSEVRAEILRVVQARTTVTPPDAIVLGKSELERTFDRDLRIADIAERAGMHPVTFARRFSARMGVTPARYRHLWRLHHVGRRLRSESSPSIRQIAEESGITDMPYFFRSFRRRFGVTPAMYRDRVLTAELLLTARSLSP